MPSSVLKAWGKLVNSAWTVSQFNVDDRPQNTTLTITYVSQAGYNPTFMPVLTALYTRFYPQAFSTISPLLVSLFSPLSPAPITTTTNLKREER